MSDRVKIIKRKVVTSNYYSWRGLERDLGWLIAEIERLQANQPGRCGECGLWVKHSKQWNPRHIGFCRQNKTDWFEDESCSRYEPNGEQSSGGQDEK